MGGRGRKDGTALLMIIFCLLLLLAPVILVQSVIIRHKLALREIACYETSVEIISYE